MTPLTLTDDARRLLDWLHRGGNYRYLWGVQDDDKETRWYRVDQTPALFNSRHHNYFGIHPTTARGNKYQRAKKGVRDIAAVNCVFAEFDAKDFDGDKAAAFAHIDTLDPAPSVIVDSGGGYHAYWLLIEPFILTTDDDRRRADRIQKGWVDRVGSDDNAKDLARVLRVPGTPNFKYDPAPLVHCIRTDFDCLYTLDELEARLPPAPPPKVRATRQRADSADASATEDTAADFTTIADAARNLGRLAASRRDAYADWVHVGMALKELGSIGFCLWEQWSKLSSAYEPGCCGAKWGTFTPGTDCDGYTLDSLARWADEDDPPDASMPDDGCTPDCPNRPRVAHLRTIIQEQEHTLQQVQERNRFVTQTTGAEGVGPAGMRLSLIELKKELDRVPLEERQPDQFVQVRPAYMAACSRQNKGTISNHLKAFEAAGLLEKKVARTKDPETGAWCSATFVRPLVDLSDPTQVVIPSKPRGLQACTRCGSTSIVRQVRIHCPDCGHASWSDPEPVNAADEAELQTAIQEQNAVEEAVAFFEQQPEPADTPPSDVLNCEMPHKENVPQSSLSELQIAIQAPAEPVTVRCRCGGLRAWQDGDWAACTRCTPTPPADVPEIRSDCTNGPPDVYDAKGLIARRRLALEVAS